MRKLSINPKDAAAILGIQESKTQRGKYQCPLHGGGSLSLSLTDHGTVYYCFGCKENGSVVDLACKVWLCDRREASRRLGAAPPAAPPPPRPLATAFDAEFSAIAETMMSLLTIDSEVTDYLRGRGFSGIDTLDWRAHSEVASELAHRHGREAVIRSGLAREYRGSLVMSRAKHRLIIPWRDPAGRITSVQGRVLDASEPKYIFPPGRRPGYPYGSQRVQDGTMRVAIVEGALDAEAYLGLTGVPALGLPGVSTRMPDTWRCLLSCREVIVAVDSDRAGESAVDRIMAECRVLGAKSVVRHAATSGDWTDMLRRRDARPTDVRVSDVLGYRSGSDDPNDPHNMRFLGNIPDIYVGLVEAAERALIEGENGR